ncbi:MAG: hypothetical protein IJP17_01585 [Clostridia bacterium]|nr:hypothetical protein [Clostridia bacterium]
MFRKLFGETEYEQMECLQKKVRITLILLAIGLVGGAIYGLVEMGFLMGVGYGLCLALGAAFYYWGWGAMKALFGVTSLAVLFAGNFILGIVIFVFYIFIAGFAGFFAMCLGTGRYIYLRAKERA